MGTNGSTMLEPLRQGLPPIDPATVSNSASCALPPRYEAVRGARRFTCRTLSNWDLADRFDDVALVVSELVTNALRHTALAPALATGPGAPAGGVAGAAPGAPGADQDGAGEPEDGLNPPVRLHLMRWASRLVCAVRDPSKEGPEARECDEDFAAESGRGLFLVEAFSDSWGWHPLAGTLQGKVVWALFRLGPE
ncbi:ATP-binding protein [Streptomyces sp. NPDC090025]|uniref:ATP-binding protein n=1 Tax=Streptomyces sp. NPDC090025 TaxID=3365922 RepID=UPI0038379BD4